MLKKITEIISILIPLSIFILGILIDGLSGKFVVFISGMITSFSIGYLQKRSLYQNINSRIDAKLTKWAEEHSRAIGGGKK